MRKILLVITAMFLAAPAFSQEIIVAKTDGTSQALELTNLKKITFSEGYLVADFADGSSATKFLLSDITRLLFSSDTGIDPVEMLDGHISYQADNGTVRVSDACDLLLTVYNASGKAVIQKVIESSAETIDLGGLAAGIYLLRLGDNTIKIVR